MRSIAVIAAGAVSALGRGVGAGAVPAGEREHTRIRTDAELVAAGLRRPRAARVELPLDPRRDRGSALLEIAIRDLSTALDAELPAWRGLRLGVAIGTSGGGMASLTRALAKLAAGHPVPGELARASPYFGPLAVLDAALGAVALRRVLVLGACASSTLAIGLGCRWLDARDVDLVIAGGFDALSVFIAAGFEALRATTAGVPAPFRAGRDGMALGEGAALLALVRAPDHPAQLGFVRGFAASADAHHATAPARDGSGLASAAAAALADAQVGAGDVDVISAHATATLFNDAAESLAIQSALGELASRSVVQAHKAVLGHTLGAAGALESLAALHALQRGLLPAVIGEGPVDTGLHARLLEFAESGEPRIALKLSAAFGGANAALVLSRDPGDGPAHPRRAAGVLAVGEPVVAPDPSEVAPFARLDAAQIARLDSLSLLAVNAAVRVLARRPPLPPRRTAVVVGTIAATLELDEAFDRRCRERGAAHAEPRRFPPTSPNLAPGQVSILLGLRGPCFAVGAGPGAPFEALSVGRDLVASGDADYAIVIAADDVGSVVRALWDAAAWAVPAHGAVAVLVAPEGRPLPFAPDDAAPPSSLASAPGWPQLLAALGEWSPVA